VRLPRLFAISAVVVAGACAHAPHDKPDPYVDRSVVSMGAWLEAIPRCAPSQLDAKVFDKMISGPDEGAAIVSVRGQLTLAAAPMCTGAKCDGGCCSTCFPAWVVVPAAGEQQHRELGIQRSGEGHALTSVVRECKLAELRQRLPATEVLASGFLEGDAHGKTIVQASLCVVPAQPVSASAAPP